jgi:hypothetical protein
MKGTVLILTLISTLSFGQGGRKNHLPIFWDKELIEHITDSLLKANANEVIVIYTDKHFMNLSSPDSLITFIIWRQGTEHFIKAITADNIYKTVMFNGKGVFFRPDKTKTFVSKSELDALTLKFVPPLTTENALFYYSLKERGYFEQGEPVTYSKEERKEKLRKKWFDECISLLRQIKIADIETLYKRAE